MSVDYSGSPTSGGLLQNPLLWSIGGAVLLGGAILAYYWNQSNSPEAQSSRGNDALNGDLLADLERGGQQSIEAIAADVDSSNEILRQFRLSNRNDRPATNAPSAKDLQNSTKEVLDLLNASSKSPVGGSNRSPSGNGTIASSALSLLMGNGSNAPSALGQFGRGGQLRGGGLESLLNNNSPTQGSALAAQTSTSGLSPLQAAMQQFTTGQTAPAFGSPAPSGASPPSTLAPGPGSLTAPVPIAPAAVGSSALPAGYGTLSPGGQPVGGTYSAPSAYGSTDAGRLPKLGAPPPPAAVPIGGSALPSSPSNYGGSPAAAPLSVDPSSTRTAQDSTAQPTQDPNRVQNNIGGRQMGTFSNPWGPRN